MSEKKSTTGRSAYYLAQNIAALLRYAHIEKIAVLTDSEMPHVIVGTQNFACVVFAQAALPHKSSNSDCPKFSSYRSMP